MPTGPAFHHKHAVLTLIDRKRGEARSFHIDKVDAFAIVPVVRQNVEREAAVATDEAKHYAQLKQDYHHVAVNHERYVWKIEEFHTNTVEGYFSIFKRGMKGVYQHCSEKHLHRYLAEFDHRYSNRIALGIDDTERATRALKVAKGKRLTYRTAGRD